LLITRIFGIACRQASAVCLLTAAKTTGHGPVWMADSSQGVGGVFRFIDSAGLAALVGAAKRAAARGGSLHMVCARPRIRQLFQLTGLDRRLAPARTLEEALDALMAARGTPR
jgi:hypothetical protein